MCTFMITVQKVEETNWFILLLLFILINLFMGSLLSCYQHKIIQSAKYCTLGLEGSYVLRLLEHQRLPVWGVKCPLKQTLSTIKCHTVTQVKCQSHRGGGFDQSASSWRLSHSVWFVPPQIDGERSPEEVFTQICQVMETFWFVQSPPHPRGPHMKFFFLSSLVSFLLTGNHPTRLPHTCARHFTRGVHVPRTSQSLSVQRRSTDERLFATFCFCPVAVSLSHSLSDFN